MDGVDRHLADLCSLWRYSRPYHPNATYVRLYLLYLRLCSIGYTRYTLGYLGTEPANCRFGHTRVRTRIPPNSVNIGILLNTCSGAIILWGTWVPNLRIVVLVILGYHYTLGYLGIKPINSLVGHTRVLTRVPPK